MKRFLIGALIALCLMITCAAFGEADETNANVQPMPDFTVTTVDGKTFTLSRELATHKAVLINFWATWCGPCEFEFPFLEEAYRAYEGDVQVLALSVEPGDSDANLREYALERSLTFPMANDANVGLAEQFVNGAIPTTVLVDRFGNVVLVEVGAQKNAEPFMNAFALLTSDDYTQTQLLNGFPPSKAGAQAVTSAEMQAAIATTLPLFNPTDEAIWPFLPGEKDGQRCLRSGNTGHDGTVSELIVSLDAKEGQAVAVSFSLSSETGCDVFAIRLNGEQVKLFSGECENYTYAVALKEGRNELSLRYTKDDSTGFGEDALSIRALTLLDGEQAESALAANPHDHYPYAEESSIDILNEYAEEIVFHDENGEAVDMNYALQLGAEFVRFYIVNDDETRFTARISADLNSDNAILSAHAGTWTIYDAQNNVLTTSANGDPYDTIILFDLDPLRYYGVVFAFPTEAAACDFETMLFESGFPCKFSYADGRERMSKSIFDTEVLNSKNFIVVFEDEDHNALAGCTVVFRAEEGICGSVTSDGTGFAIFTGEPKAYTAQVMSVPEGYTFDTAQRFTVDANNNVLEFVVKKNQR